MSEAEQMRGPATPADSPLSPQDVIRSPVYRDLSTARLALGDPAFDFTLPLLDLSDGKERDTGRKVTLSSHAGDRPVALVFGSYT